MARSNPKLATDAASDDSRFSASLDERIAEMRALLAEVEPATTASALRALRDAFPDVPLNHRVRVLREARR